LEVNNYINQSANLGVKRIVLRKLNGRESEFPLEELALFDKKEPVKKIFGCPVYEINGVEVTVWDFDKVNANSIYLFSDGRIEDKMIKCDAKENAKKIMEDDDRLPSFVDTIASS
jgi:hypothetical protein